MSEPIRRPRRLASERVLERSFGGDLTPYDWLARTVSGSVRTVVDLTCGTGTLTRMLLRDDRRVIGVDPSPDNLAIAARTEGIEWLEADPLHLPLADGSVDAVVTSVGFGVVPQRVALAGEVARVLRPGGMFAALTPSMRPMGVADLRLAGQLGGILRVTPHLPGLVEFRARTTLAEAGMTKVEDSRARYHFSVANRSDAELLVQAIRPMDEARGQVAVDALSEWAARGPVAVPLPMRRIVALR